MNRIQFVTALFTILTSALLTACNTTESPSASNAAGDSVLDIAKGSSTEDLIALLGEPKTIKAYEGDPENVTIWIYETEKSQTDMVAYETQEIPYIDPITGEERMIEEPLYKAETKTRTQITQVYVVDEKVIGWKVDFEEKRQLNN
ncbi:hypothetical protein VDG1235_1717 [Verrucomicrobiia bacterium DG1235]|nr:hypothetical protein VDG1235_1717 [Verrucomicrobiae bacterium DG1235]